MTTVRTKDISTIPKQYFFFSFLAQIVCDSVDVSVGFVEILFERVCRLIFFSVRLAWQNRTWYSLDWRISSSSSALSCLDLIQSRIGSFQKYSAWPLVRPWLELMWLQYLLSTLLHLSRTEHSDCSIISSSSKEGEGIGLVGEAGLLVLVEPFFFLDQTRCPFWPG